jgi:nicotinamidase-related amidase
LEAPSGFEPLNKGFADLCLTTWLRRRLISAYHDDMAVPNRSGRCALALLAAVALAFGASAKIVPLKLRTRVEPFKGSGEWRETLVEERLAPEKSALILCDLWDQHWCQSASERTGVLARKAAPVVDLARQSGILVIHAPSDTMNHYATAPQRLEILKLPATAPPIELSLADPPLPIDDSDGGCDTANNPLPVNHRAWSRQHPAIRVAPGDLISDNGNEVYSALKLRGINTLLVAGVHTNMCILNRTFAIRQMTKWGIRCILIRDLTDAMYNPARRPFVSHDEGTQLVIEHIEKYWAPTITSAELVRALKER